METQLLKKWLKFEDCDEHKLLVNEKFIKRTQLPLLANSKIIKIKQESQGVLVFLTEKNNVFSLTKINISENFPVEKSRIIEHINLENIDLHVLSTVLKERTLAVREKFDNLIDNRLNTMIENLTKEPIRILIYRNFENLYQVKDLSSI